MFQEGFLSLSLAYFDCGLQNGLLVRTVLVVLGTVGIKLDSLELCQLHCGQLGWSYTVDNCVSCSADRWDQAGQLRTVD